MPKNPKTRRTGPASRTKGSRRRNELPTGPASEPVVPTRSSEAADEDVDRGSSRAGRQEGVESSRREGEVSETGGRQEEEGSDTSHRIGGSQGEPIPGEKESWRDEGEPATPQDRTVVDERQRVRETGHHGKV